MSSGKRFALALPHAISLVVCGAGYDLRACLCPCICMCNTTTRVYEHSKCRHAKCRVQLYVSVLVPREADRVFVTDTLRDSCEDNEMS